MHIRGRTVTLLLLATLVAFWATAALAPAAARAQACTELITNGDFETTGSWQFGTSPVPPQYITSMAHSGMGSLQLGITSGPNVESFSSARQTITIPTGASQVTLSFWFYTMVEAPASGDYAELALLSHDGSVILAKPWQSQNDSPVWNQIAFDLSTWQGQTIQVYFNVYNNGASGKAAMLIDSVSLTACPVTATPTSTGIQPTPPTATFVPPTVTASPTPGCTELVRNGSFSSGLGDWEPVGDPSGVTLASDRFQSAPYSLKLGSLDLTLNGLAAARQPVTIPVGSPNVTLDAWIFTQSQPGAGADYQEIALLNSSGALLYVPYRGPANDSAWIRLQFNLAAFAGQTVYLRFAANNDGIGGRTVMYIDDVRLTACSSGVLPTALPTATATPAPPLPTWTPLPTLYPSPILPTAPVPVGCAELTQNGGFEMGLTAWVPGANPVRPAVVSAPVLSGAYSAQLGSQVENRSSYSSIRQTVSIPWGYARTIISYWAFTWSELSAGQDIQQFVLLGPGNVVWAAPWKVLENQQAWQQHMFEIVGVAGQTFDIYFGVVNDGVGGRTALYVDEVHLWGCSGDAWPLVMPGEAQAEAVAQAQAVPVPQVYPVETLPAMMVPEPLSGMAAESEIVPSAEWTVVAIGTVSQPVQPGREIAAAPALQTLEPLVEITPIDGASLLGTVVPEIPIVTVSLTPQPPTFLSNITSRWPPNWPFILIGIIVVAIIIVLIVRARQNL